MTTNSKQNRKSMKSKNLTFGPGGPGGPSVTLDPMVRYIIVTNHDGKLTFIAKVLSDRINPNKRELTNIKIKSCIY